MALVGILVAGALAVAAPLLLSLYAPPRVAVTGASYVESGCAATPLVTFRVTLTNLGDLDAVAVVSSYQNGILIGSGQWAVPAHHSIEASQSFVIDGCGGNAYTYLLDSITRA